MASAIETNEERPAKRVKLLLDDNDSDGEASSDASGGVTLTSANGYGRNGHFKINKEFARRFEHNQKRVELHRLEEKYGKQPHKSTRDIAGSQSDAPTDSDGSSTSLDEDDEGILASGALDEQFSATLKAIRSKDPRVYDKEATFYTAEEEEGEAGEGESKRKTKPMYLSDYHRQNLLAGHTGAEEEAEAAPTYTEQQKRLKTDVVKEMHAAAEDQSSSGLDDDGFLIAKPTPPTVKANGIKAPIPDVESASKDPETFLSNYLSARAWVPTTSASFQPFESDDSDEERRADAFEEAYNLRFEDPKLSNEKLVSHARDTTAQFSVRRESKNPRKRAREAEQAQKQAEKDEREREKAMLRGLKIEEMEGKLRKIREAAGLKGKTLRPDEWAKFLDDGWDNEQWEEEMQKRFGDEYYQEQEGRGSDDDHPASQKKKQPKKPKWNDDIDINDLVPDFVAEDPEVSLPSASSASETDAPPPSSHQKKPHSAKKSLAEAKRAARRERRQIESLVDQNLPLDLALSGRGASSTTKPGARFRYRETSPTAFGLTPRDILMATDSQLNQFAGLKKMATFRDAEKKRRDRKRLGKKGRLRMWRKETFGDEAGPRGKGLGEGGKEGGVELVNGEGGLVEGKRKKKKRSRKGKSGTAVAA